MLHFGQSTHPYLEEINPGIIPLIGTGERVLDVGCGRGALGEAVRKLGNNVTGIERHPDAVAGARSRLDRVIEADVTDFQTISEKLEGEIFDAIIFSDVLEHLYDPVEILRSYSGLFLKPGGRVLISVPNIAAWTQRLALFFGYFEYADTGIMDRTHIRFFTRRTAKSLLRACGIEQKRIGGTPHLIRAFLPLIRALLARSASPDAAPDPRALIDSPAFRLYEKWVYPIEHAVMRIWPSGLAFRIIVEGVKSDEKIESQKFESRKIESRKIESEMR
ncbi:hypothetical protein AUK22_04215 [bacterium CG2_30_54_10]|nr:MAG: hypothetical protein AUK22_04215 [bacterium CG2_30_54_10]